MTFKPLLFTSAIATIVCFACTLCYGQVGIGTSAPNSKAILDISSTDKGLLLPRMNTTQRLSINPAMPARGLLVFDTDSSAFMFWTGTNWQRLNASAASGEFWSLGGNALTGTERLGTTNNKSLVLIGAGIQMFRYDTGMIGAMALPRITGGSELNQVSAGAGNSILNGESQWLSGNYSSILGGAQDTISGQYNAIAAGRYNKVVQNSGYSFIGAGNSNSIFSGAVYSAILTGSENLISTNNAAIGAGIRNDMDGYGSFIGAGIENKSTAFWSFIGSGQRNVVEGNNSMIGAGHTNKIFVGADSSFIGGGGTNYVVTNASSAVVVGGRGNGAGNTYAAVVGGRENFAEGARSFIGGGANNRVIGSYGTIAGGWQNLVDEGAHNTVSGGRTNVVLKANYSSIGGGYRNAIEDQSHFGTIGGGDSNRIQLSVEYGSIGGGKSNTLLATARYGSIGGGELNKIEKRHSVIGGGLNNWSRGEYSTVGGGNTNEAGGDYSVVAGGAGNSAAADYATVMGGRLNNAWGNYSIAAGYKANIIHPGNFVFADFRPSAGFFDSKLNGQFMVRVQNGALFTDEDTSTIVRAQLHARSTGTTPQLMADQVGDDFARIRLRSFNSAANHWDLAAKVSAAEFNIFRNGTGNVLQLTPNNATNLLVMSNGARLTAGGSWTNASDSSIKDQITGIDETLILEKLASLPISSWHYKSEANHVTHIGPMAQDFKASFGLGDGDKTIATVDADGVNMAAIKALYEQVKSLTKKVQELEAKLAAKQPIK